MSESTVVAITPIVGTVLIAFMQWRQGKRITGVATDAKTAAEQTANSHADAEYPNLRDELTAVRDDVKKVSAAVTKVGDEVTAVRGVTHSIERRMDGTDRHLSDLHRDDGLITDTIDREKLASAKALAGAIADRDQALDDLRRDIPAIIRTEIRGHVADCPLRTDPKGI